MWRGTTETNRVNFLTAKLDWLMMSDKVWPHFVITRWNRDKQESETVVESCNYIEWTLVWLELKEEEWEWKKSNKIIFELYDEEWNDIKWRIWYWPTVRKVIQKLSWPKEINKVRFSCGRYSMDVDWKTRVWNYVTVFVDWQKWDDPFDFEKDIKPKRRAIVDPETNEFIKYNDTALDEWIFNEVIPFVQWKIRNRPIAKWDWEPVNTTASEKDISFDEKGEDDYPF